MRTLLHRLFSQAKTKGCQSRVDIGVKYADKQQRMFDDEKMKAGQCVIGLQVQFSVSVISQDWCSQSETRGQGFKGNADKGLNLILFFFFFFLLKYKDQKIWNKNFYFIYFFKMIWSFWLRFDRWATCSQSWTHCCKWRNCCERRLCHDDLMLSSVLLCESCTLSLMLQTSLLFFPSPSITWKGIK